MGHTDMKQSNQSTNEDRTKGFSAQLPAAKEPSAPLGFSSISKSDAGNKVANGFSSSMWSTDGLMPSSSSRLFQRSSSTPPTKLHGAERSIINGYANGNHNLRGFSFREAEENNQDEDTLEVGRPDLVTPLGPHIQRSWSAPPVPENFDDFFKPTSTMPTISEAVRRNWPDGGSGSFNFNERASTATLSPHSSPTMRIDRVQRATMPSLASPFESGRFRAMEKRRDVLSLVDRVQEDFPRTPSPVLGYHDVSKDQPSLHDMAMNGMKHLRIDNPARIAPMEIDHRSNGRRGSASSFNVQAAEYRPSHRVPVPSYLPTHATVPPPGFQAPRPQGIYGTTMVNAQAMWAPSDVYPRSAPVGHIHRNDFDPAPRSFTGAARDPRYLPKYCADGGDGIYGHPDAFGRVIQPSPLMYDLQPHHHYAREPVLTHRVKSRGYDTPIHPSQTYSATSLLEEFKSSAKADKWDLRTIQGYLAQFARDQAGSRFIQQKLEKADDHTRHDAFNEIFPQALPLMADVFGNYVIQKLFDHGNSEQHRRLVGLMKNNMVTLALQVYGCRVIQKALEVTQVEDQLVLIKEMRGHVMKCVIDQNGNHVLQKCIEAASWQKRDGRHVTGEDIQFIVDDFVGHATALSMHAYGCRVIQRVLEHCPPNQIRPIVNEIVLKCRDLIKDQFGNYVVQHVICHGERDQRNAVMKVILPDVAKWSQHKYASNVVEACLDVATKEEIRQIISLILDCDESGASCALLPMMKHMYGNYVVQKLLDRADHNDRPRIVRIIQHNSDYLKRFTYGKHVLSRLEREGSRNNNPFQ